MGSFTFVIATDWNSGVASAQFRALAQELAGRGHMVVFVANHHQWEMDDWFDNPLAVHWPAHYNRDAAPVAFARNRRFAAQLYRRHRPDCVLIGYGPAPLALAEARKAGIPCRMYWHRTLSTQAATDYRRPWFDPLIRLRWRRMGKDLTWLLGLSESACTDGGLVFDVPSERHAVIMGAIRDPLSVEGVADVTREPGLVVCPARFHPSKGQDVLLHAVAALASGSSGSAGAREAVVEFLGDGPVLEASRELAASLGIADRCRFPGQIPREEVYRRMRAAAIVVLASRAECFGNVVAEALAVETAVVVSAVDGPSEIVRDGVEGVLVPPGDAEAMAAAIGRLLADEEERRRMGAAGRKRFRDFNVAEVTPRHADWLEWAVTAAVKAKQ